MKETLFITLLVFLIADRNKALLKVSVIMSDGDTELRDLVSNTLENSGFLSKIRVRKHHLYVHV